MHPSNPHPPQVPREMYVKYLEYIVKILLTETTIIFSFDTCNLCIFNLNIAHNYALIMQMVFGLFMVFLHKFLSTVSASLPPENKNERVY